MPVGYKPFTKVMTIRDRSKSLPPLVVIVGETASGKTALALDLAERFNGEIIAADSRTVYKGMDIGTAKPTLEEQARVRHHLIDVVTPEQTFTAAEFQRHAKTAIADIIDHGTLPIMVGGTGLYIDSVLFDFTFRPVGDPAVRRQLEAMTVPQLQRLVEERGLEPPTDPLNKRHLVRTLETNGQASRRQPLRDNTLVLGLSVSREELHERIVKRVDSMLTAGLEQEVRELTHQYGWQVPGLSALGYAEWQPYFAGEQSLEETRASIIKNTQSYAKRQRTWFKRNDSIRWLDDPP